jgi:hypothetical protein
VTGARRPLAALATLAVLAPGASASAATLAGTVTGGRLPAPGAGVALVRVVNLRTLEVAATDSASRRGAWSVRGIPAGTYSALTSLVRANGPVTQAISAPVRAKRSGRVVVRTTLKRKRAPRRPIPGVRSAAQTGAVAHASPTPVVMVRRLSGSGPEAQLGRGLSEMLIRELGQGTARCPIRQKEGLREDAIAQEIALQNSGVIDPRSFVTPHPIAETLIVRGSVSTTADTMTWSIQLVDARTGAVVGGDEGTARGADGILDEAPRQIAEHLLSQICGARYDVALSLRTDATFASHIASGTVSVVLSATGARSARGAPPTRFTGNGPLGYGNLSFIPTNECALSAPVSNPGSWSVVLEVTSAGRLRVTWDPEASGGPPTGTATITCPTMPPVPVPDFPGPRLVNPDPRTFELPVDGGRQAIAGGIQGGGQGWAHSGTITVTRIPG